MMEGKDAVEQAGLDDQAQDQADWLRNPRRLDGERRLKINYLSLVWYYHTGGCGWSFEVLSWEAYTGLGNRVGCYA